MLELKGGYAPEHLEVACARKRIDELLRQSVGEVLVLDAGAQINEREHRKRRFIRLTRGCDVDRFLPTPETRRVAFLG